MINRLLQRPQIRFSVILIGILLQALPAVARQEQAAAQQAPAEQGEAQQPAPVQQPTAAAQPAPAQQQPQPGEAKKDEKESTQPARSGTSKDRLFYTLPNFLTVENAGQEPPLSSKQKFKVVLRSSFDPVQFAWYGFLAGVSQAENSEPGYGQGADGYWKRYGASFADGTIENFWTGAILPSVLHQDPRFYQLGKGGFWHRTGYAISRIVVTRSDSGHNQFNASEIFGSAIAAGISTYGYHPHDDKTLRNTASVWGTQIGYDTITIVVKEFWPDIRRKIHKKKAE